MKYIALVIGLLAVGCGNSKELTAEEKKVVGTYELKEKRATGSFTLRVVVLDNGAVEAYANGKKHGEGKWIISKEGGMHIIGEGETEVFRINKDGSITLIAIIDKDGKRTDIPKDEQLTIEKIK